MVPENLRETITGFHRPGNGNSASTKSSVWLVTIYYLLGIFLLKCLQNAKYDKCYKMRKINFLVLLQDAGKVFEKNINSHINLICFRTWMQEISFSNRFIIFIITIMLCYLLPPTWRRCHTMLSDIICLAAEILAWYCVENERNQMCTADIFLPPVVLNDYSSPTAPQKWLLTVGKCFSVC